MTQEHENGIGTQPGTEAEGCATLRRLWLHMILPFIDICCIFGNLVAGGGSSGEDAIHMSGLDVIKY